MVPFLHRTAPKTMEENPLWLVVLCDIMTNLMLFFLVMYAFTRQPEENRRKFVEGLSRTFAYDEARDKEERAGDLIQKFQEKEASRTLKDLFKRSGLSDTAEVELSESQIRVRLPAPVMFPFGEATLTPKAQEALTPIGKLLAGLKNQAVIEGHTDNVPVSHSPDRTSQTSKLRSFGTSRTNGVPMFGTNWELSVARAHAVLQYLSKTFNIPENRFIVAGYGEFHPIDSNSTKEGRARNRRIEIVIMRKES